MCINLINKIYPTTKRIRWHGASWGEDTQAKHMDDEDTDTTVEILR